MQTAVMEARLITPEEAELDSLECEHCGEREQGFPDGWTQIGRSRRRLLAEGDNPIVLASWCPLDELRVKHHQNPSVDELIVLREALKEKST